MFFTPEDYFQKLFERARNLGAFLAHFGGAVQNTPPTKHEQMEMLNEHIEKLEGIKIMMDEEISATKLALSEIGKNE